MTAAIIISCVAALTAMLYTHERIKELGALMLLALKEVIENAEKEKLKEQAAMDLSKACTDLAVYMRAELKAMQQKNDALKERVDLLEKIIRSTDADEVWKNTVQR